MAGNIPSDDESLPSVNAIFTPKTCSLPWLVDAVCTLGNQSLQSVLFSEREHFVRRMNGGNREAYVTIRMDYLSKNSTPFSKRKTSEVTIFVYEDVEGEIHNT
jgi:hypothetical protein